jgi:hypothetical protein
MFPIALVVVVEEDLLAVRGLGPRRVEPLLVGVGELVVEDGGSVVDVAALEGLAGLAVVVTRLFLIKLVGSVMALLSVIIPPSTAVILYS